MNLKGVIHLLKQTSPLPPLSLVEMRVFRTGKTYEGVALHVNGERVFLFDTRPTPESHRRVGKGDTGYE